MNFKIIKLGKSCKTCAEVLLAKKRTDGGEDYVEITAWHEHKEGNILQQSDIDFNGFENQALAISRFIIDFSELSAAEFANSMKF